MRYMSNTGFVEIKQRIFDWPLDTQSGYEDHDGKRIFLDWIDALSLRCLTTIGLKIPRDAQLLLANVKREIMDRSGIYIQI